MSTARSTCWSVTINNPTDSDEEFINLARQKGWTVSGQKEVGANGTPHYQLMIKTPQVRFAALKKAFPRAHIEPARNAKALDEYVHKDDTRVGQLKEQSDAYPSLSKLWTLVLDDLSLEKGDELMLMTKDELLSFLDSRCAALICEGYHVETLAVNPQVRSAFAKFAPQLHRRCNLTVQTDRQTDNEEEIVVPTLNADETPRSPRREEEDDASSCGSEDSDDSFSSSEYT